MKFFTLAKLVFLLLFLQILWWVKLHVWGDLEGSEAYIFNLAYGTFALFGGLAGIWVAQKWGGFKSYIGKTIILLSVGVFCQWIANYIWGYYNLVKNLAIPYPSEADVFFFSVIPLYGLAMFYLAKATGATLSLRNLSGKLYAVLIPLVMLGVAYGLFLRQGLDLSDPVRVFFDLGYPLGEAITFSIALFTFLRIKDYLGGVMRKAVLGVIGAYLLQFIADYGFLYTNLQGTYYNASWVDLFYAFAILGMSLAIINFDLSLKSIKHRLLIQEEAATGAISLANTYNIYNTIILSIVKDQEKIIGPLAIDEANSVSGLKLSKDYHEINVNRDPTAVTNELISNYKTLFGKASVEIMKESISKAVAENPNLKEISVNIRL